MLNFLVKTLFFLILIGCSPDPPESQVSEKQEPIQRRHDEFSFVIPHLEQQPLPVYPWEEKNIGQIPRITKEFFHCKGNLNNSASFDVDEEGKVRRYDDCGGSQKHSLPIREGNEFIYPILIDLLNHIQEKTQSKVIITCGYRCPTHNQYADPSKENQYSKHQIGAEVDFYVQGLEHQPEQVIILIMDYYQEKSEYQNSSLYREFQRYTKDDTNVAIHPWYNKEIFIKLFQTYEGRDFDNQHPYPYINLQVRYDRDKKEKVIYTWPKAHKEYYRW